jgi:Ni/Co efflux regulator RcnB
MRGLIGTALAVVLLSGTSALAQNEDHHRDDRGGARPPPPAPSAQPSRPATAAVPRQAAPVQTMAPPANSGGFHQRGGMGGAPYQGQTPGQYRGQNPGQGGGWQRHGGPDQPSGYQRGGQEWRQGAQSGWQNGQNANRAPDAYRGGPERRDAERGAWDRGREGGWDHRQDGRRPNYDPDRYPRQFQSEGRYRWRGGEWREPRGFYYRHWSYGEYFPRDWFGEEGFISDWWDYGLATPPWGYEWIRSGPDALLIDQRTGFVAEAAYGVFY